jgi:hypothetical protein
MDRQGDEVHVTHTEARSGSTPHVVRYILAISLVLVVIAFTVIVLTGALSSPQGSHTAPVSNQAAPTSAAG